MINIQLEYDQTDKPNIDEKWIQSVCEDILNDNKHNEAFITIIFSNDSSY